MYIVIHNYVADCKTQELIRYALDHFEHHGGWPVPFIILLLRELLFVPPFLLAVTPPFVSRTPPFLLAVPPHPLIRYSGLLNRV